MWIDGSVVLHQWEGGKISITEVLYDFEGPVVFRANVGFNDFLFSKREENEEADFYLAVETNDQTINALKEGRLSLRGALYQSEGWLIEASLPKVFRFQSIPEVSLHRFLPAPHAGLYSKFGLVPDTVEQSDAFISFRFLGEHIRRGHVPLTVLKEKIDQFHLFVRKALTPSALLNGRDYRFFDVQMAEPRFKSLVLAAMKPEFDTALMSENPRLQNVDTQTLIDQTGERGRQFWSSLVSATEQIDRTGALSSDFVEREHLFLDYVQGLVPATDSELENVEVTFNDGMQIRTVLLDRSVGDQIVDAYERSANVTRTISGVISEINGDSATFLIKNAAGRQTTCEIPRKTFENLDAQGQLRRGREVQITGEFERRPRRDRIWSEQPIVFLS